MNKIVKFTIVVVLVFVVAVVIAFKENHKASPESQILENTAQKIVVKEIKALPRLVDLGADNCVPCKMMAPILKELKKEYEGLFNVEFIDVWKNPEEAKKYGIKIIPTQIFFNAAGQEVFRHKGFFSKEDILLKWKELSIDVGKKQE